MSTPNSVRIGCGSAYSRDPSHLGEAIAERGDVEYLCCDRLAERTLANATTNREEGRTSGYNPLLEEWFERVLPVCVENDITIVGNFGAANPEAAGEVIAEIAADHGFDLRIATVLGDDVLDELDDYELTNLNTGEPLVPEELPGDVVSANAYIGVEPILEALEKGADVVVGGRIGDLSLFLAPLMYEFGWEDDDYDLKAAGSTVAHLLECGTHSTGGNFAYPGYVEVPGIDDLGLPLATVYEDGEAIVSKVEGSGGVVTELSMAAQLVYEVHDPENYLTPDVVADVSDVTLEQVGPDEVRVSGAKGKPKPDDLKVLVGVAEGCIGELESGWGGRDALAKADLTIEEAVRPTLTELDDEIDDVRIDRIGVDAIHGPATPEPACEPNEVRMRVAIKTDDAETAERVLDELEPLAFFTAIGGGGMKRTVDPYVGVYPTVIPRDATDLEVRYVDVGVAADGEEPEAVA